MNDLFDWRVMLRDIGDSGVSGVHAATAEERAELVRVTDIRACERLDVAYQIKPARSGHYRLTGRISADIVQSCVITLEPVQQHIDEALDVELRPADTVPEADEGEQDILAAPDVDLIDDDSINLGLIVLEHISTAIDPYPRLPGAELDVQNSAAGENPNPFAVLSKLKDRR